MDNNFLKSLPKTIGELKKLKTLQVSNNELEVIPPGISLKNVMHHFNPFNGNAAWCFIIS